jgi:ubiquinone/menaquinone biosynthesis C-methylase UbiE
MKPAASGFDRLARIYRGLEFIAFGRDLERARFEYLGRLCRCRSILLLGEGDGRCVARLAELAPEARITCVDSSPGMIARAARRLTGSTAARVEFLCTDVLDYAPQAGAFDAVATLFFLDCFTAGEVESIVGRVRPALKPGAPWLFADFALPPRGPARLRARCWLAVLYFFFRAGAGLRVSSLPPSEDVLERAGWQPAEVLVLQGGMIRSVLFAATGATGARAASP